MHDYELSRQFMWIAAWGVVAVFCMISLNRNKPVFGQETEAPPENKA